MRSMPSSGSADSGTAILPLQAGLVLAVFLLGGASAAGPRASSGSAGGKPNLLIITIDTLRPDRLSCYGSPIFKTEAIDGLAEKGIIFQRAFAQVPLTLPSHTTIMVGKDPLHHGVHDNAHFRVGPEQLTLAEHLKGLGYATGAFVGGFPLDSQFGLDQGFDVYDDAFEGHSARRQEYRERKADAVVSSALRWLDGQDGPWFLWVHCFDPHDPYEPPEPFLSQFKDHLYTGEVAYVDSVMKKLLAAVGKKENGANTVIVLTGDHGEGLGQHGEETHGYFAYNTTLWIPLIVCAPGLKPGRVDQTVVHMDIFPTVCELLGVAKPKGLQGISILPATRGQTLPRRSFYFETLYPYYSRGWAPLYGYLQGPEKFIDSPIPEAFDIALDFDETTNVLPGQSVKKLRDKLAEVTGGISPVAGAGQSASLDARALEKLRSLGYVSSAQAARKDKFGPSDDPKTMLPFHAKAARGRSLYESGRRPEGIALLEEVMQERPDLDITYPTLAQIYAGQGRVDLAIAVMKKGAEAIPGNISFASYYIHFLNESGKFDDVIQMLTANGGNTFAEIPESWNDLGVAYLNKGELEKALDAFHKAVALDDGNYIFYRNLGDLYFAFFVRSKDSTAYKTSLDYYRKALGLNSEDPSSHNGMGYAYLQGGEPRLAIPEFERALKLSPDYTSALYNLAQAAFKAGDFEKALESFAKFKERYTKILSPAQIETMDAMIRECRSRIR
ncbi:MAG TPA: sulfatase-like hydrolase/transferase [Candidatus Latescibacteria bacterium]|nr:sulfatase-like hydrolase/transferase [Candidatus Latescibacterota bacterium]